MTVMSQGELPMSEAHVNPNGADSMTGNSDAGPVPRALTLSGFVHEAGFRDGIAVRSLPKGTTLTVGTRNSQYRLIVLDDDEVILRGGTLFPEAVSACLQGASAGGSSVRIGWIEVGLRMELCVGPRRIVTSPVTSITVESLPPKPPLTQYHA
jgi:hypothetical protein